MSQKPSDNLKGQTDAAMWAKMLEDIKREDALNPDLTDEEKQLLNQLDQLSDEEWEPVACDGEPVSETIIKTRGEHCDGLVCRHKRPC